MSEFIPYWGETHHNTFQFATEDTDFDAVLDTASKHLDFYAAACYTSCADAFEPGGHAFEKSGKQRLILEGWKPPQRIEREWALTQELTGQHNRDGRFVTFPGYEWQGDGKDGDHNVYAKCEGLPIFRVNRLAELYAALRGREALAIPHHTGYRQAVRGRNWDLYDEALSPFTEIYSLHGCSETDEELIGLRTNPSIGPGVAGGTYQDALNRGHHLGAIASTDGWGAMPGQYDWGLMGCLASELSRDALWDAFIQRRVYAVTGDRIQLDFTVNGQPMGSVIPAGDKRTIRARVRGWDAIDRIELLRDDRVIATHCHQGTWDPARSGQFGRFKIRIEAGWGPRANELDVPDRNWSGRIELGGGRIVGWQPCWICPGQSPVHIDGGSASFGFLSTSGTAGQAFQNADVFELEAAPDTLLTIALNSLSQCSAIEEFCRGSVEMWFKDECAALLRRRFDLDPAACERNDVLHHMAYKVKLHKAIPEAGYCASLEIEDDEPIERETHYRVRVEQRNGQRAWSSPIWVSPGKS